MKRIVMILMVMMMLVGCAGKVTSQGQVISSNSTKNADVLTDGQAQTAIFRAVEEYEGQADPKIRKVKWDTTGEIAARLKDEYRLIESEYEHLGRIYKVELLIQFLPDGKYKQVRYTNLTTGKSLK